MGRCCPGREFPWAPDVLNTEYQKQYVRKQAPAKRQKEPLQIPESAKLLGKSIMKSDYPGWKAERIRPSRQSTLAPNRPFDDKTAYKDYYKEFPIRARELKPKKKCDSYDGKFYPNTTNKSDYIKHPSGIRYYRKGQELLPPKLKFDATTNYRDEYIKRQAPKTKNFRPERNERYKIPFRGGTTHEIDYPPKELPPKRIPCPGCPWTTCSSCKDSEAERQEQDRNNFILDQFHQQHGDKTNPGTIKTNKYGLLQKSKRSPYGVLNMPTYDRTIYQQDICDNEDKRYFTHYTREQIEKQKQNQNKKYCQKLQ